MKRRSQLKRLSVIKSSCENIPTSRSEICSESEGAIPETKGLELNEESTTFCRVIQKTSVRTILVLLGLGLLLFIAVPGVMIAGNLWLKFSEGFFIGFFTGVVLFTIILVKAFSGVRVCLSSHYSECIQRRREADVGR